MSSIRVFKLENLSPENTSCLVAPKSKMKYEENEGYGEEKGNAGISHSCTLDLSPKTTKISYSKTLANTQNMRMKYGQGDTKKRGEKPGRWHSYRKNFTPKTSRTSHSKIPKNTRRQSNTLENT